MQKSGMETKLEALQWVNFDKASPEALSRILNALNAELEAAKRQNRFPTVEGAFERLGSFTAALQ